MLLHLLFFCSGLSGLIYQVVWARQLGNVYGNTVYSGSIVVAIFMLGLGVGGYVFGALADRRYRSRPGSLVRFYGVLELLIAGFGVAVSIALPYLGDIVARLSWYQADVVGWHSLTFASYLCRAVATVVLLGPMTVLMGGTLTVLVRAVVRSDLRSSGWRVALLYSVNTIGAGTGALLTDFVLVPITGLMATQFVAVGLNLVAAAGALWLARDIAPSFKAREREAPMVTVSGTVRWAALALALSGFAALGMEILWLRHFAVLLGGFRAVFSLLLTVMLFALGAGALFGGWLDRRSAQPVRALMVVQALFAATVLFGLASGSAEALAFRGTAIAATLGTLSPSSRVLAELWFNVRPMLLEVAVPSFIGGVAFPLANAIVQNAEASVARRAGVLYAANTVGAVCGSLVTGYLLLPWIGMQGSAAVLAAVAASSIVPLHLTDRASPQRRVVLSASSLVAVIALAAWMALPDDFLVRRALGPRDPSEHVVTMSEGVTELLAVVERPERGRGLLTNGHAMSSTAPLDQRYMRALAHIPLLALENPQRVLVIGFGVGNTTHAATLHASVRQVDVADLSRHILEHAAHFRDANRDVLTDSKVAVYVNDGRQHLQMTPESAYDLITLEPPPIGHAGVAALYSREFYELARSRLTSDGYVSQWLPAYQVPAGSSLAMVRAFIDVFPQSVLLSGAQAELLLIGTNGPRIALDPGVLARRLEQEVAVRQDLFRVDLGTVREIAGTFVGSAETLARATTGSPPVTDDRPLQEYGVLSGLSTGLMGVPSELFDVASVGKWCPKCLEENDGKQTVPNLDLYLRFLQQAYTAPVKDAAAASSARNGQQRRILESAYLGAVVPDSAEVHNLVGLAAMREGRMDDAVREFESALIKEPRSANARANLGQIRYDEGAALLESRRYDDAAELLRTAVDLMPESAEAQNDLGVALASMGRVAEATEHFRRAVDIQPDFVEARRNLESALRTASP
jgi:predicted membrane-bound spermidine synthase